MSCVKICRLYMKLSFCQKGFNMLQLYNVWTDHITQVNAQFQTLLALLISSLF